MPARIASSRSRSSVVSFLVLLGLVGPVTLGLTVPLGAQCDPGSGLGGLGTDVIVGDILPFVNSYGSAGEYHAYAIGARCLNIGTEDLGWTAITPEHPVIAQNLYRYEDGRFEQVGMSWLKHAFAALNIDSYGCGCTISVEGLGPGCADTYGAGLSGNQTSLGPRSEVYDPAAGAFLYPVQANPPIADLTARRLRVWREDIHPQLHPGATFIAESHYVAPDDAADGNAFNNASWIEATFADDPDLTMSVIGTTTQQRAAIEAWPVLDPSVTIVPLLDGDGGRIFAGGRVGLVPGTNLYEYEYAIHNLNSTLAVGSFEVPMPAGTIVSAIGFHDIDHHSGEPYDTTDWPGSVVGVGGSAVQWATNPFAGNPDANAIRWGTLYNFRFRTAAPPEPGTVEVGLFEAPGTTLTATLPVPGVFTDCDGNGLADAGEILAGEPDCDGDGVLDACEPDCNGNGIADDCDLAGGTSLDGDGDGVPDECVPFIRGDANTDAALDLADAILALGAIFAADPVDCVAALDANGDAFIDVADPIYALGYLFTLGPPPPAPFPDCGIETTLGCATFGGCP